jgi:hypothetical protein
VHAYNGGNGTATQCRQKYTSRLILGSDAVWTLGDHAYPNATLENLRIAYSPTWGRKKRVTYPTPGDHDYDNARRAYHQYFGTRPYYTFTMGGWRVFSLNSEINHSRNSAQVRWLRRKLSSSRADCIAAYWSVPRWSSGSERGDASFRPFVRSLVKRRADLMLGGDTHNYERFARQTATGARRARGIRQFVVGTGGRSLDGFSEVHRNSQVRRKAFRCTEPDSARSLVPLAVRQPSQANARRRSDPLPLSRIRAAFSVRALPGHRRRSGRRKPPRSVPPVD